jgi:hypothetical protein
MLQYSKMTEIENDILITLVPNSNFNFNNGSLCEVYTTHFIYGLMWSEVKGEYVFDPHKLSTAIC